ncbi:hypothetical protein DL98DRAFT_181838 [Cadophora sp. DSE1049]|nr:hypothetical protein DL98DRAFT_181838 [Cadophora sp. DSE1049]
MDPYRRIYFNHIHGPHYHLYHPTLHIRYQTHDPRSIIINISSGTFYSQQFQHTQAAFSVFFGPSSPRSIASYAPLTYTQSREIAELFAVAATLRHILEIVVRREFALPISKVVMRTSRAEQGYVLSGILLVARTSWWTTTRGTRFLFRDVRESLDLLESLGVEILFAYENLQNNWEAFLLLPPVY